MYGGFFLRDTRARLQIVQRWVGTVRMGGFQNREDALCRCCAHLPFHQLPVFRAFIIRRRVLGGHSPLPTYFLGGLPAA